MEKSLSRPSSTPLPTNQLQNPAVFSRKPATTLELQPDEKKRIRRYQNILIITGILIAVGYGLAIFFLFVKPPSSLTEGPLSLNTSRQLPDADLWRETYVVKDPGQANSVVVNPDATFQVQLEIDEKNPELTNVFLIDENTHQRNFYTKLKKVYRDSAHPAEFHHGNLYVLHRVESAERENTNVEFTDELWKYRADGKGRKLFTSPGADFRVAPDNEHIVVTGTNANLETGKAVSFISGEGVQEQAYEAKELQIENIALEGWAGNTFWISQLAGPIPQKLVSVSLPDYDLAHYSLEGLSIGKEYSLNPASAKIAYSDYPILLDVESDIAFHQRPTQITLKVTDLIKNQTQNISTSMNKQFLPHWKDSSTLEFTDPQTELRTSKVIQ